MVRIHVKASDFEEQQFLYDCECGSSVALAADAILEIYNLQSSIRALIVNVRQYLFSDDFKESFPDVAIALDRSLSEAETYSCKEQVLHEKVLSPHILQDHIQIIEKEIKIAQSRGLQSDMKQFNHELHKDVELIWAGKKLSRGKKLCEYIGENDKTKITIKLKFHCEVSEKMN